MSHTSSSSAHQLLVRFILILSITSSQVKARDCFVDNFGELRCRDTLPPGTRVGIAVGSILISILIFSFAFWLFKRRAFVRRQQTQTQQQREQQQEGDLEQQQGRRDVGVSLPEVPYYYSGSNNTHSTLPSYPPPPSHRPPSNISGSDASDKDKESTNQFLEPPPAFQAVALSDANRADVR